MKRLSTSLLIFILALLAVPDRAWAWTSVELRGSGPFDWTNGTQMTRNNENSFTYEFTASENFDFKFYVSNDVGWVGSYDTNYNTVSNYDGSFIYWCSNINDGGSNITFNVDSKYTKYRIDLTFDNTGGNGYQYFKFTVTGITEGGGSDPVSTYKLMEGDGTNEGSQVATFTGTDFPYTATYNIDAAGIYYFYVNDGSKNYFHNNQEITEDGGTATIYQYEDNYFDRVVKLKAPRAGEYTFKFNHVQDTEYTLQCNFPSETETKYTVTVLSANETMGTVSTSSVSVNGTTGVEVTATAEEGYTFDNWTTTGGVTVTSTTSATTTVTATAEGTLTANFKATSTEPIDPTLGTSSNGKAYYLATEESGTNSIFGTEATKTTEDNTVTYSRILRFNDNGDGSYELNIPATISGNVWILEIDKQNNETTYRPVEAVAVGKSNPADNSSINGSFGGSSTVFTLTDRGDVDGIYNIKLNLNTTGVPAKWTITHDPLTRVAYYLSTASMSSASPVYDKRNADNGNFSNRFIGTTYFDKSGEVDYYVISNIVMTNEANSIDAAKAFDNSVAKNEINESVLPTVNKLLLQGNGGYEFRTSNQYNEVSPQELPFKTSSSLQGLMQVEYDPSKGYNGNQIGNHYGMRGQIIIRSDVGTAETTSMTIVGPLVAASVSGETWTWNHSNEDETLTDGISSNNVMKFDETENCYTITIVTNNEQQGKTFRFVRNGNSGNTWTEDATVARIPYYDNSATGSAATVADPNNVNYQGDATDRTIDILFNRPAGRWTIKFYIVNEASGDGSVQSKYYYTINAEDNFSVTIPTTLNKVLRTYSYGSDVKPQDENVHVYVAHRFGSASENDQYTNTKTGTVHLYEINYVPANTGVILYCGEGTEAKTVTFVEANEYNVTDYATSKTDKTKLWKNSHEGDFNNDLEPVLARTFVDNSVMNESGDIIARNFCMSLFSKTTAAQSLPENSYTDYIGFFRVKSYISANKAYLQYGTDIINENAQIFGQDTFGEEVSSAKLAMVFEGFEDDNIVTGISDNLSVKPVLTDDGYYNLQGMRVEKPVKGIYIHNGKKVVVK
ncbi:MAG: hypothetical protein ACI4A7_10175 [Prevotella sp.]